MTRPDDDSPVAADVEDDERFSLVNAELWSRLRAAAPGVQLGRLSIALHQIQRAVDAYLDDNDRAARADVAEGWPELAAALDEMSSWYETWAVEDDPQLRAALGAADEPTTGGSDG